MSVIAIELLAVAGGDDGSGAVEDRGHSQGFGLESRSMCGAQTVGRERNPASIFRV